MASSIECWWNKLQPTQRVKVFRFIPLRSPKQLAVFSRRRWHELHAWMRNNIRELYGTPGLLENFDLIVYFRAQKRLGRGQSIHGVTYFVISAWDREAFPQLDQSHAIALEELSSSGKAQYWLIQSEAAYDEDVLLSLSGVGLCTREDTLHH